MIKRTNKHVIVKEDIFVVSIFFIQYTSLYKYVYIDNDIPAFSFDKYVYIYIDEILFKKISRKLNKKMVSTLIIKYF